MIFLLKYSSLQSPKKISETPPLPSPKVGYWVQKHADFSCLPDKQHWKGEGVQKCFTLFVGDCSTFELFVNGVP